MSSIYLLSHEHDFHSSVTIITFIFHCAPTHRVLSQDFIRAAFGYLINQYQSSLTKLRGNVLQSPSVRLCPDSQAQPYIISQVHPGARGL